MFPASTKGGGVEFGFPDVCKTPSPSGPVAIPYPNGTYEVKNKAANSSPKNIMSSKVTFTSGNKFAMSKGDETGTIKGVASSITMGKLVGNAPLLKHLVDKAQAKGYKVMIEVKADGKAIVSLQNTPLDAGRTISIRSMQGTKRLSRSHHVRSGTEGMEWLLRRLG